VRAVPTSRAYWELRAEQVLNRVFSPEAPIDVEVCDTPMGAGSTVFAPRAQPADAGRSPAAPRATARRVPSSRGQGRAASAWNRSLQQQPALVMAAVGLTVTTLAGSALIGLSLWGQSLQAMRQERTMLLVERLRAMGPATMPAPTAAAADELALQPVEEPLATADDLPPPPLEPWMEELATLPASSAPAANVLKVPMSARVSRPAPPAASATGSGPSKVSVAPAADDASLPQLVGVVQVPGQNGSAIFQVGGSSTSAAIGESIGNSGWRLAGASGDTAVIERNGQQRRISISGGS
jgi:hypothetical protein